MSVAILGENDAGSYPDGASPESQVAVNIPGAGINPDTNLAYQTLAEGLHGFSKSFLNTCLTSALASTSA